MGNGDVGGITLLSYQSHDVVIGVGKRVERVLDRCDGHVAGDDAIGRRSGTEKAFVVDRRAQSYGCGAHAVVVGIDGGIAAAVGSTGDVGMRDRYPARRILGDVFVIFQLGVLEKYFGIGQFAAHDHAAVDIRCGIDVDGALVDDVAVSRDRAARREQPCAAPQFERAVVGQRSAPEQFAVVVDDQSAVDGQLAVDGQPVVQLQRLPLGDGEDGICGERVVAAVIDHAVIGVVKQTLQSGDVG